MIDLRLSETDPRRCRVLPGVDVLKARGFGVKLEVDTDTQPIERVARRPDGSLPIADITIEDPPMEEIIAAMYRDQLPAPAAETA